MVGTLLLTYCDGKIGKLVTGPLSKDNLDMAEMRAQIRNMERSPRHKPKNMDKLAGGAGLGLVLVALELEEGLLEYGALFVREGLMIPPSAGKNAPTVAAEGIDQ